jgi:hypothetical protein
MLGIGGPICPYVLLGLPRFVPNQSWMHSSMIIDASATRRETYEGHVIFPIVCLLVCFYRNCNYQASSFKRGILYCHVRLPAIQISTRVFTGRARDGAKAMFTCSESTAGQRLIETCLPISNIIMIFPGKRSLKGLLFSTQSPLVISLQTRRLMLFKPNSGSTEVSGSTVTKHTWSFINALQYTAVLWVLTGIPKSIYWWLFP